MRIAMLSWESLHSIAVGGVAAHVTELAAALARKGHQIHVFTVAPWVKRVMTGRMTSIITGVPTRQTAILSMTSTACAGLWWIASSK